MDWFWIEALVCPVSVCCIRWRGYLHHFKYRILFMAVIDSFFSHWRHLCKLYRFEHRSVKWYLD